MTALKQKEAQIALLESKVEQLEAKHAHFETVVARVEALESRPNSSIQLTAEKSLGAGRKIAKKLGESVTVITPKE